ncbi:hypothetical protein M8J76_009296 [Diaphorina citri]|nr:hypothetical protein M8J76_009296 [Diaphorina citri]
MIELDSNDVFEPVLFSSNPKSYMKSNSIVIMLLDSGNNTSHLCLILLLSVILVTLFYITLFMKTYQQAKIKMITKSKKVHVHHKGVNVGGAKGQGKCPAPQSKRSDEERGKEETGREGGEEKVVKGKGSGVVTGAVKAIAVTGPTSGGAQSRKAAKEKHTSDTIYRKSVQSSPPQQQASSNQSEDTSPSSSPAKSNRKRNPRISEPPPWRHDAQGGENDNTTVSLSVARVETQDETSLPLLHSIETPASRLHSVETPASRLHSVETPASRLHSVETPASRLHSVETPASRLHSVETPASRLHSAESRLPSVETPLLSRLNETESILHVETPYEEEEDDETCTTASSSSSSSNVSTSCGSRTSTVSCSSNSSNDSNPLIPDMDYNKENRPELTNTPNPNSNPTHSTLTRRQKKNRVRRNMELNARIPVNKLSRFYQRLGMKDAELHKYLSHYVMTQQQLINFSFPFESKFYANKAVIYSPGRYNSKILDPKAREFVPSHYNLSQNKMLLKNQQVMWRPDIYPGEKEEDAQEKICARCSKSFFLVSSPPGAPNNKSQDGGNYEYLTQEHCHYHWGKVTKSWNNGVQNCIYSCCNEEQYKTSGCVYAKLHVWSGLKPGINGPLEGYVKTKPRKSPPPNGYGVYALDTEMVYTVHGLEVARVTVVNVDGRLIYNTLVKPDCEIIDYNTKYSGISAKDFIRNPYKTLKDVQNDLMGFVSKDSIIVGHGLENDLRALKLIHSNIIDTSVLFPHSFGLPYRRSLKSIVSQLLHQSIQSGTHDSFEDARACIDLILWKLLSDFRYNH